jgi:hypothetical protein
MMAQKMAYHKMTEGIKVKLPVDFVEMSDDDLAYKYPSTKKPLAMLTSGDKTADFGVNVSKTLWGENDLKILQKVYKATLLEMYQKVDFLYEGIKTIDNVPFVAFEFTSEVENHKKYSYLLYRTVKKHVYVFNFTCPQRYQERWQAISPKIIESIQFNINIPDSSPSIVKKEGVKYYRPKRASKVPSPK